MATERKLDIFELLNATDRKRSDWLSKQSMDAQKEFAPVVVLRWAATVNDGREAAHMLWMVNKRVNINMFNLSKHPELVFKLLASCGMGKPLRHAWIAPHKRKSETNKALELLATCHPGANERELAMLLSMHDRKSFSQLVEECGIQADAAKDIMKAYDKVSDKHSS